LIVFRNIDLLIYYKWRHGGLHIKMALWDLDAIRL